MPIYEYQCTDCAHRLEALQKISDPPLTECPACHANSLKKLVSAASFRLKGGGWYETDFKKEGRKQLATSDAESAPKDDKAGQKTPDKNGSGKQQPGAKEDGSRKKTGSSPSASKTSDPGKSQGG